MKTSRGKRPSAFNKEVISFLLSQNISLRFIGGGLCYHLVYYPRDFIWFVADAIYNLFHGAPSGYLPVGRVWA